MTTSMGRRHHAQTESPRPRTPDPLTRQQGPVATSMTRMEQERWPCAWPSWLGSSSACSCWPLVKAFKCRRVCCRVNADPSVRPGIAILPISSVSESSAAE